MAEKMMQLAGMNKLRNHWSAPATNTNPMMNNSKTARIFLFNAAGGNSKCAFYTLVQPFLVVAYSSRPPLPSFLAFGLVHYLSDSIRGNESVAVFTGPVFEPTCLIHESLEGNL